MLSGMLDPLLAFIRLGLMTTFLEGHRQNSAASFVFKGYGQKKTECISSTILPLGRNILLLLIPRTEPIMQNDYLRQFHSLLLLAKMPTACWSSGLHHLVVCPVAFRRLQAYLLALIISGYTFHSTVTD
ncbi:MULTISPECIES: hypothetical protein [Enterobacteriaceae]|uniref:hypothetical protein n=1 Tax=Enterobacteriaceae TaxID=543 RepID=UPI00103D1BC0|nr:MULTISPECIES: hypothetical protein [Enterobacteriaceae]